MIIVLKKGATQQDIDKLTNLVTAHGVQVNPVIGTELTILGLVGDTSQVDPNRIESFPCVERIMHVAEPSKRPTACSTRRIPWWTWPGCPWAVSAWR